MENLNFTRLMTAKIIHDLASPLGSIGMSVELVQDPDVRSILEKSYFICDFKLKFYRLILSTSQSGPNMTEAVALLNSFALHQNIVLNWGNTIESINDSLPYSSSIIIGFIYVCLEMLIRGGNVSVEFKEGGFILKAFGSICKIRENHKRMLQDEIGETPDARNIFVYFLMHLVKESGMRIRLEEEDCAFSLYIV
jgi:hypothetical protein